MEEEEDGDAPPFCHSRPGATAGRRCQSTSASQFFLVNPTVLIVLVPVAALLLVFFVVPSFVTITSQILRPNAVKKSWDSLNILLVLFAILCGIFARNKNDDESANNVSVSPKTRDSVSRRCLEYAGREIYNHPPPESNGIRLRRSSSSYPDLRQVVDSLSESRHDRLRFFDDFYVSGYYRSYYGSSPVLDRSHRRRRSEIIDREDSDVKVVPVDTFVVRKTETPSQPQPQSSSPPPPPPPPPASHQKPRGTYQSRADKKVINDIGFEEARSSQPPPPPPARPPPSGRSEQSYSRRKRSGAKKEITNAFASFYNQRKRKRKNKAKTMIDESLLRSHPPPTAINLRQPSSQLPLPSPPPPPPPPPPRVFGNLFRRVSKNKKVYSVTPPAPPAPPPPPSRRHSSLPRSSKHKSPIPPPTASPTPAPEYSGRRNKFTAVRPPFPTRGKSTFYNRDDNVNSGGQSPLIPMPQPPPPPPPPPPPTPFSMPEMKSAVRGDYVRIQNAHSSRCGSPELDDVEASERVNVMDGGDGARRAFCPSPDVNVKADTFIARLRDGWRLEKMNSMKEKEKLGLGMGLDRRLPEAQMTSHSA